jgi:hypothetical protein
MKRNNRWVQKVFVGLLPVLIGITFARATPDEAPCGMVMKIGKGAQIIPSHGRVQTKFTEEFPVGCSSMVITHQETFWIRLADQTVLKIAPQSFVEIPKSGSQAYRVYRGQILVSAPPGISTQTWSTPNSEAVFKGGIAYIQYHPDTRVTTVSCFNREFTFRNKFNENASTVVHTGEMSHLAIQEASVNPAQPAVMNHTSVTQVLAELKLDPSDQAELVASVKRIYDDRAKSLASEIEDWDSEPLVPAVNAQPARSIASVPVKVKGASKPVKAIDPSEAEFVSRKMHERLYGDEEDQKMVEPSNRKPASVKTNTHASDQVVDTEQLKEHKGLKNETKRLEKEIETIRDDE